MLRPGAISQGFELPNARRIIAGAIEELSQVLIEKGKPLPVPAHEAHSPDADRLELPVAPAIAGNVGTPAAWTPGPPQAPPTLPSSGF